MMQKKRWADLSAPQRIGVIIAATIQFCLLVGGLWDLWHQKPEDVRGDRRFWTGFMFVNWIGPIAYFAYGRRKPIWASCPCCKPEEPAMIEGVEETAGFDAL